MIGSIRDVMIWSEAEFERLPDDGRWEVVDGRAILLPPERKLRRANGRNYSALRVSVG